MNVKINGNTITLPNGIKRTFKATVQRVIELEELGWFILLDTTISNNVYALKPNGGLWWRLKSEQQLFVKQLIIETIDCFKIQTVDDSVCRLNPNGGILF